ncbi:MAG: hypothetical protein KTR19_01865 [Hyphomicrobiales bacterium]|nr:hypothetical protein [Hyphomicrobiales bacterium]
MGDSAVRGSVKRLLLPLVGGFLSISLAACETQSNSSSSGIVGSLFGSDEPRPVVKQQEEPSRVAQSKPISFAPIIGAPAKISSQMSQELATAATAKGLKVQSSASSGYTVRGYLVAASAQTGTKLSYIWDIRDQNGQRAERFQGDELIEGKKGGDPWALVDDVAMKRIAASTADKIATWMFGAANVAPSASNGAPQEQERSATASSAPVQRASISAQAPAQPKPAVREAAAKPAPAQPPAASKEIIAVVPPVTGAPGDGQQSLTSAMKRHLASAGVKLVEGAPSAAYTVRGTVELGSADGGQQPITIRWLVVDPNGQQIDKAVVQRNKIPAGSLDGAWGQIADLAASEAAKSVAKLIRPTG